MGMESFGLPARNHVETDERVDSILQATIYIDTTPSPGPPSVLMKITSSRVTCAA